MSELLPCPFCGGEAEIVGGPENWTPTFYDPDSGGDPIAVVCKTCACGLHFFDGYAEAIAAWNRRTDHIRDTTEKVSNAGRIRSMSDGGLARQNVRKRRGYCVWTTSDGREFTSYLGFGGGYRADEDTIALAVQHELDWLKQPVKEEHHEAD